ncbi:MAG: hypothetical protein HY327_03290 [Chloroflexi bacterium]|nr:hypothetical protein [Chloroflexota bacterium]
MARGSAVTPIFLQTLTSAYIAASAHVRAHLDSILPIWMRERGHLATLQKMIAAQSLDGESQKQALIWLKANGIDGQALIPTPQDIFYQAYHLTDESQSAVFVFSFYNPKRNRVQGMNFLIDFNPPWDGAVKDITLFPPYSPDDADRKLIKRWGERGTPLQRIGAEQAKTKILTALLCNRKSKIRLPRDLVTTRTAFARYILGLLNAQDTPVFSDDDFEFLSRNGQSAEEIMNYEHNVGRRVRMPDGRVAHHGR